MLRRTLFATALLAASVSAAAGTRLDACDAESDYALKVEPAAIRWTRSEGTPGEVVMGSGRLTVDGRELALDRADRARIANYEATVRQLLPEIKAIAREAVGIAFTAVVEVAQSFAADSATAARSRARLAELEARAQAEIERSFASDSIGHAELERLVEQTVETVVPELVGDVVGQAVSVALSGDSARAAELEARVERMERTLEAEVEARARVLEQRAEALCPIVASLDRIESSLALRLADGAALDLVRID